MKYDMSKKSEGIYRKSLNEYCSADCESIIISYLIWDIKKGSVVNVFYDRNNYWYLCIVLDHDDGTLCRMGRKLE